MLKKLKRFLLRKCIDQKNDGAVALNINQIRKIGLVDFVHSKTELDESLAVEKYIKDEYGILDIDSIRLSAMKPADCEDKQVLSKKSLAWTGRPIGERVEAFQKVEYDLLIDLSSQKHISTNVLMSCTKAQVKSGRNTKSGDGPYDVMISLPPNSSKQVLVKELFHVLKMINA